MLTVDKNLAVETSCCVVSSVSAVTSSLVRVCILFEVVTCVCTAVTEVVAEVCDVLVPSEGAVEDPSGGDGVHDWCGSWGSSVV